MGGKIKGVEFIFALIATELRNCLTSKIAGWLKPITFTCSIFFSFSFFSFFFLFSFSLFFLLPSSFSSSSPSRAVLALSRLSFFIRIIPLSDSTLLLHPRCIRLPLADRLLRPTTEPPCSLTHRSVFLSSVRRVSRAHGSFNSRTTGAESVSRLSALIAAN